MQNSINLERLKAAANTPEALQNILSAYSWKRSGNAYRAKEHGSYSIYCKDAVWLFTAHNGDYKTGDVLTVAADVHGLDLHTKDGLHEATKIVCEAANLNFSDYCADAKPSDYRPIERKAQPIETKVFLPNAKHPLSTNFTFEVAEKHTHIYNAAAKYYERKTGVKQPQNVVFLQSMTFLGNEEKKPFKTDFNHKKIGVAYLSNGLAANIKVKVIDTATNKKKMFTVQNVGNYVFGLDSLPTKNRENITLLLCAGEDDASCINANLQPFGFYAISLNSESSKEAIEYALSLGFKAVYTFYDADETGVKMSIRNKEQYGLPFISMGQFAELSDCKDICNIYQKHGARLLKAVIVSQTQPIERIFDKFTTINAKQGEYLSDVFKKEGVSFTSEFFNNTQVVSPTGSGKSVTISQIKGKKVVVCPTIALCKNFMKHGAVISTGAVYDKRDAILEAQLIATTHANLPNLLTIIDPKDYHIAIDEAHNFTTSASKKFMLKDLKRTLRLSHNFANRSFWTGTDLYNFHGEFDAMKKITVNIPKPQKQAFIIDAKSVIQSTIDRAKASIEGGRFPIILLNNKKELLSQITEGVKNLGFHILNSDEKETAFFKELTETGNIPSDVKGIITTSVIKEGNDIYNNFDFDFLVCNTHESIFHSIEIEQLVNRARQAKSTNVFIIKSKTRKKITDTFDPIEVMKTIRTHTNNRVNELNNCPNYAIIYEKNAQFGNDYAFIENEVTGRFELCELLLSYKVFEAERRFELSNEAYQRTQLEKFGFIFSDTTADITTESEEIKAVFKTEREARKEQKRTDFEATKSEILQQIESGEAVILPNVDTAPDGKKFAVACFERLTEIGIQPEKVFELIDTKGVKNESDLNKLVKSVSLWQLNRNSDFMKENGLTAIRLQMIFAFIMVGGKYSTSQFRGIMRRALNLEKGFNTRHFDNQTTNQDVLSFIRLFFDISVHTKTKVWIIKGILNYDEYIIENKSKKRYPNELIFNHLEKKTHFQIDV